MDAHTEPAANTAPTPLWAEAPADNAMTALYRVALGPINRDYYLPIFARFDTLGRATASWNWAACLCTLSWMVFRQVWGAALVYVAVAEGLALLLLALGRQFLNWPQGVEWGVMASLALLAFAVPGLYGNAILHTEMRRRITRALAASRTVPEACVLLNQKASTRLRLRVLVAANVALATLAALAYVALPGTGMQGLPESALQPAITVADAASAATMATPPATPATEVASAAALPAPPEPLSVAPEPAPDIPPPAPQASAPAAVAPKSASAPPPAKPVATAPRPAPRPTPPATPPAKPRSTAEHPAPATPPMASGSATSPTVGSAPGYYINVGLFAEEANARKAQARLLNEGLPAFRQELQGTKGRRIRVRVGPYDNRAQADAAAQAIRAMALEAVVFKQ